MVGGTQRSSGGRSARITSRIGAAWAAITILTVLAASAAQAQDIPAGGTLVNRSEWAQQPPGGAVTQEVAGDVVKVWGCVRWEQLTRAGAPDLTCGYLFIPHGPPAGQQPPRPGQVWRCTKGPNAVGYTVPFNGVCGWYERSQLPAGAFEPDPEVTERLQQEYLRAAETLPPLEREPDVQVRIEKGQADDGPGDINLAAKLVALALAWGGAAGLTYFLFKWRLNRRQRRAVEWAMREGDRRIEAGESAEPGSVGGGHAVSADQVKGAATGFAGRGGAGPIVEQMGNIEEFRDRVNDVADRMERDRELEIQRIMTEQNCDREMAEYYYAHSYHTGRGGDYVKDVGRAAARTWMPDEVERMLPPEE
jgi:hypothetical protein